jgi:hypothetical protein
MPKTPKLVPLVHGDPWCELCRRQVREVGNGLVAWWPVRRSGGRVMPTAYCSDCHHENKRARRALR